MMVAVSLLPRVVGGPVRSRPLPPRPLNMHQ